MENNQNESEKEKSVLDYRTFVVSKMIHIRVYRWNRSDMYMLVIIPINY